MDALRGSFAPSRSAPSPCLIKKAAWRPATVYRLGGNATPPFFELRETNQERKAIQVQMRQSLTFAHCVSRLLVRYSWRLIVCFLRSNPPTVHNPYFACLTNVPRFS